MKLITTQVNTQQLISIFSKIKSEDIVEKGAIKGQGNNDQRLYPAWLENMVGMDFYC